MCEFDFILTQLNPFWQETIINPELPKTIQKDSQVDYFTTRKHSVPPHLVSFFNHQTEITGLDYTKIKIETLATNLTADLWIKNVVLLSG